jgi:hypothetical protein
MYENPEMKDNHGAVVPRHILDAIKGVRPNDIWKRIRRKLEENNDQLQ